MNNLIVKNREMISEPLFIRDRPRKCYEIRHFINNDFFIISIYDESVKVTNYFKYHIFADNEPVTDENGDLPIVQDFLHTIDKLMQLDILQEENSQTL